MTTDTALESALDNMTEQDVNTETDASTVSNEETDDNNSADASTTGNVDGNNTSDTSSGEGDKNNEPQTLEETIAKAIDEVTEEAQAEGSPPKDKDSSQKDEGGEPESSSESKDKDGSETEGADDAPSEEEKAASAEWHEHPATKRILSERKKARAERDEALTQVKVLDTEASQFRQIRDYLAEGNVSDQDAATALQMVRLWYENPSAMFQELERMRSELGTQLGAILPADLQAEVDQGLISPERAAELAKAKGTAQVASQRVEQVNQQTQVEARRQEMEYRTQLFTNWATQVSNTDPDLNKKLPLITAKMAHYLATEGDPGSPQVAWDRLNRAHQEVTANIRGFIPKRKETPPSPRSSGPSTTTTSAPSTFDEAMGQAIDRAMAGGG